MLSSPLTMEELTINLPHVANGVRNIGDLWDCRNTIALGSNIFLENKLEETQDFLEVVPVHDMTYNLSRVKDSNGKSEILGISLEVAFEIAGTIAVEGAASFKKEDIKKLDEDEFLCNYEVQTFVVRTRPSVSDPSKDVINPDVKKRIDIGSIFPTHFVSEVRLGGSTFARLRIQDKVDHDNLELSGSLGGKFPVGPITFGIKASIAFKEKESSAFFKSDILVDSRPGTSDTVTSTEDMFRLVERLPLAIEKESYLPEEVFKVKVTGVPISYKLTPLTHLFELGAPNQYFLLERELMAQFNEMIFTLYDIEGEQTHYFRKLLREKEPRVLSIFPKPLEEGSSNPWVVAVDQYQTLKEREATALRQEAMDTMMEYKWAQASLEDIMALLDRYRKDFNLPGIQQKGEELAEEGRGILRGLRVADATGCGIPDIFIFSPSQLEMLEGSDTGMKIILRTNGTGLQGVHTKFYSLASHLSSIGFIVRVAAPNISQDFSLTIKILGTSKVKYMEGELIFALHILKQITLAQTKAYSAAATFLNLFTTVTYSQTLAGLGTTLYNTFIAALQNRIKNVRFAETLLQCLETVAELQATTASQYVLLLPIRFPVSSWDSYAAYRTISSISDEEEDSRVSIVVGNFDLGSNSTPAPSAILLDMNSNVVALCQDKFDRLILLQALFDVNGNGSGLDSLHPKHIFNFPLKPLDAEFTAAVFELVDQSGDTATASNEDKKNMTNCPFLKPFLSNEEENAFNVANNLLISASASGLSQLVSVVFWEVGGRFIFTSKLSPIMHEHGWTDPEGFPEGVEWSKLLDELREAKTELGLDPPPPLPFSTTSPQDYQEPLEDSPDYDSENIKLDKIIDIVAYAVDENKGLLIRLIMFFMEKFFHIQYPSGNYLTLPLWKRLQILSDESDPAQVPVTNFLFKAIRLWQMTKYNESYFQLFYFFDDSLDRLEDSEDAIALLVLIKKLPEEEKEWVWRNPKVRYWIGTFKDNQVVMRRVFDLFVENEIIPGFIPTSIRSSLIQVMKQIKGEVLVWNDSQEWKNVNEMLETFRYLEAQQTIPAEFMTVLTENLRHNVILYDTLKTPGALFYWDEEILGFRHSWGVYTLRRVIDLVTQSADNKVISSGNANSAGTEIQTILENLPPIVFKDSAVLPIETYLQLDLPLKHISPFVQSKSQIRQQIIAKYLSFLFGSLKHGNSSVLSYDRVKSYFGYPITIDPPLLNSGVNEDSVVIATGPDRTNTNFFHFPLSTVFAPSLSCFNSPPPNICYRNSNNYTLVKGDEDEEDLRNVLFPNQFISRSDLLTFLFEQCENAVVTELINRLAQSLPMFSLPWFIPTTANSTEDQPVSSYRDFTKCLQSISIPSKNTDHLQSKAENLLTPPYKLILCIRVGTRRNHNIGESTLLNTSLLGRNQFASKLEPGYVNGNPLRRRGFVELLPLSETTCSSEFYQTFLNSYEDSHTAKPVLLGNVHGVFNSSNFPSKVINTLIQHSSSLVIFWECENWREVQMAKLELDELLANHNPHIPQFNIILDADDTISAHVEKFNIVNTSGNYKDQMGRIFNRVLLLTPPISQEVAVTSAVEQEPVDVLLDIIHHHSISFVKASLALQQLPRCEILNKWEQIIENPVWHQVMTAFFNLLGLLPLPHRTIQLCQLQRKLQQSTANILKSSSENIKLLRQSFFHSSSESFTKREEIGKEVQFLGLNVLTPSNLFEEINILTEIAGEEKVAELFPDYRDRLAESILMGCPIQLSPTNGILNAAFSQIQENINVVAISILDFSMDMTSSKELIHSIFGVDSYLGLDEGKKGFTLQFVPCSQGMRKYFGLSPKVEGILLSVGQGLGSPERNMREKKEITSLLLTTSDLTLVHLGNSDRNFINSNWSTVLGTGFLTLCLLERDEISGGDVTFVQISRQRNNALGRENENGVFISTEIVQTVGDLLGFTSNLVKTFPLPGRFRNSVFEGLDSTLIRIFDETLFHPLQTLRHDEDSEHHLKQLQNHIFESLKFREGRSFSNWYKNVTDIWDTFLHTPTFSLALSSTQDSYQLLQERGIFLLEIKRLLERAFLSHENIYIKQIEEREKPFFDFDILNKVPYFCTLEDSEGCWCTQSVTRIQIMLNRLDALGLSDLDKEAVSDEIHGYTFALKNQLIESISRKNVGIPEPNQRISTPWTEYILSDVEKEYGPRFTKDIETEGGSLYKIPNLDTVTAYDLRHEGKILDILTQSNGRSLGDEKLGWEAAIWLQLQIEMMVKADVFIEPRYRSGMVRNLRGKVEGLLQGEFYERFCLDEVMHLSFYWDAHRFAISMYLKSWETIYFSGNVLVE